MIVEVNGKEYDYFKLSDLTNEELEIALIDTSKAIFSKDKNEWLNPNKQNGLRHLILELERIIVNDRNGAIFVDMFSGICNHVTYMSWKIEEE